MKNLVKKWWFWTIIIIVLLAIGGNKNNKYINIENSTENTTNIINNESNEVNNVVDKTENQLNNTNTNISNTTTDSLDTVKLKFGVLQSFTISPDTNKRCCIIKAKIESSYSNKATIHQNFFNVEDFIKKQNGYLYDEIQYYAVADMTSGNEAKVISFTLDKNIIDGLYNEKIAANTLDDYLKDFWVIESLK